MARPPFGGNLLRSRLGGVAVDQVVHGDEDAVDGSVGVVSDPERPPLQRPDRIVPCTGPKTFLDDEDDKARALSLPDVSGAFVSFDRRPIPTVLHRSNAKRRGERRHATDPTDPFARHTPIPPVPVAGKVRADGDDDHDDERHGGRDRRNPATTP